MQASITSSSLGPLKYILKSIKCFFMVPTVSPYRILGERCLNYFNGEVCFFFFL